jgi:hypothetical protein
MGFLCSSKKMKLITVILIFHRMRTIPKLILKRKVNLKRVNKEKKLNKQNKKRKSKEKITKTQITMMILTFEEDLLINQKSINALMFLFAWIKGVWKNNRWIGDG